eukprot:GHVR01106569.1.p1 GENE.GHVR01106569.1~~GHVR01106569.1.p1  ORF type:complete len:498 (+),score=120.19 GHVR01106569.1:54-1547(+)
MELTLNQCETSDCRVHDDCQVHVLNLTVNRLKEEKQHLTQWGQSLQKDFKTLQNSKYALETQLQQERAMQQSLKEACDKVNIRNLSLENACRNSHPRVSNSNDNVYRREIDDLRNQLEIYSGEIDRLRSEKEEAVSLLQEANNAEDQMVKHRDTATMILRDAEEQLQLLKEKHKNVVVVVEELTEAKASYEHELVNRESNLKDVQTQLQQMRQESLQRRIHGEGLEIRLTDAAQEIINIKNINKYLIDIAQKLKTQLNSVTSDYNSFVEVVTSKQNSALDNISEAETGLDKYVSVYSKELETSRAHAQTLERDNLKNLKSIEKKNNDEKLRLKERFKDVVDQFERSIAARDKVLQERKKVKRVKPLTLGSAVKDIRLMCRGTQIEKSTVGAKTHPRKKKMIQISSDFMYLQWGAYDAKKAPKMTTKIPLQSIYKIIFGERANTHIWALKPPGKGPHPEYPQVCETVPSWCCFSVWTDKRSYDFFSNDENIVKTQNHL